jgi:predicted GNAT superfamily acetyltransferase
VTAHSTHAACLHRAWRCSCVAHSILQRQRRACTSEGTALLTWSEALPCSEHTR